jgi:hypothetical protein
MRFSCCLWVDFRRVFSPCDWIEHQIYITAYQHTYINSTVCMWLFCKVYLLKTNLSHTFRYSYGIQVYSIRMAMQHAGPIQSCIILNFICTYIVYIDLLIHEAIEWAFNISCMYPSWSPPPPPPPQHCSGRGIEMPGIPIYRQRGVFVCQGGQREELTS